MKKILKTSLTGDLGVNLIAKIVLQMNCQWYPTGGSEAGIDGTIELLDPITNEATTQILAVQSKATANFSVETDEYVEFTCKERDLAYWLQGNTPVILVYSKPVAEEAYWVSIKDYFSDQRVRATRKIRFNKQTDRFNIHARSALERIIAPKGNGLYLGAPPREETLYSDLVPIRQFPTNYYVAPTEYGSRHEIIQVLKRERKSLPGVWTTRSETLYSLDPLDGKEWKDFCDQGAIDSMSDLNRLASSEQDEERRLFVELMNLALRNQLYDQELLFERDEKYFYEKPHPDLAPKELKYESRTRQASRTTFKGYKASADSEQADFYRHAAFKGKFVRFAGVWYLQIESTYHFTKDGKTVSSLSAAALSGIKRLENNQAVHGQVLMWARRLQQQTSYDARPRKIFFADPLKFRVDTGFDDNAWLKSDVVENADENEAEQEDNS
jgi:hypothetical protein